MPAPPALALQLFREEVSPLSAQDRPGPWLLRIPAAFPSVLSTVSKIKKPRPEKVKCPGREVRQGEFHIFGFCFLILILTLLLILTEEGEGIKIKRGSQKCAGQA